MVIGPGTVLAQRYRAGSLLGRGGMGEVWRCRDLEQGHDVAIKAVRAELLDDPSTARLFHNEVVAVARLNHPGIVPVYDLIRDAHGALLVMELREGVHLGTFSDAGPSWTAIREVLTQILEALAYAHSRGVLHLDIKPENVMVESTGSGPSRGGLRVTLLDFGVARVRRPGRGVERWFERDAVIGTVEYMPPEQCAGTFERFGPWSDLFSLGVVAFELCAGYRPFPGAADAEGLLRRLSEPPPLLQPAVSGVPGGFTDLCAALLAIEPRDRPATAADVLATLRALGSGYDRDAGSPRPGRAEALTEELTAATEEAPPSVLPSDHGGDDPPRVAFAPTAPLEPVDPALPAAPPSSVPSFSVPPITLAVAELAFTTEATTPPAGAYGLFGLRDLPVLGRPQERLAVWRVVRAAAIDRRTQVVLLEGPTGVGKSRLARDTLERAVELGLGSAMQTAWSAEGAHDEGLRGLVENLLDTRGEPAPQVRARLDFWLDRQEARGRARTSDATFTREIERLLCPPRDAAPDPGLALRVALEAIARAATARPVLLWLDDVQWSRGEAAALLGALGAQAQAQALCVIATVRTDEIDDGTASEILAASPGCTRVPIERLDLDATRRLVRGLLDVDEELCEMIAARAEGNPLFAGLLLRQLVGAEAISRREGRYRLTGSFDLSAVPAGVDVLLRRRVDQSGAGRRELGALALMRGRVSLDLAAELGRRVEGFDEAVAKALMAGLIHVAGGAYVWEHGLFRRHLIEGLSATEAAALHAAAAEALAPLVDRDDVREERAHHLRAAGKAREACEAMIEAGVSSRRWAPRARSATG